MENASKALIIAGSVLIGVMIISFLVYTFSIFGKYSSNVEQNRVNQQIEQVNSKFTKYDKLTNLKIHDVVTVAYLANDNNSYFDLSSGNDKTRFIKVKLDGDEIQNKSDDFYQNKIIHTMDKTFTCTVSISDYTKYVYEVKFTQNNT